MKETKKGKIKMLKVGDKIYYIDYEVSKTSYTIQSIYEVKDNSFMKSGTYYRIHADNCSDLSGYSQLPIENIDSKTGRFFSSQENAHERYKMERKNTDGMTNTHRKEIENVLKDGFIKEKNYEKVAEDLRHKLKITSLEESSINLFLYLDDMKELLAKGMTQRYDYLSNKKRNRIIYLCQNYYYLNLYLSGFLSDCNESHTVESADWLIKEYIYWLVTDKKVSMKRTSTERNKPSFGTFEQWCDFIEYYIQSRKKYCPKFIEISNILIKDADKKLGNN